MVWQAEYFLSPLTLHHFSINWIKQNLLELPFEWNWQWRKQQLQTIFHDKLIFYKVWSSWAFQYLLILLDPILTTTCSPATLLPLLDNSFRSFLTSFPPPPLTAPAPTHRAPAITGLPHGGAHISGIYILKTFSLSFILYDFLSHSSLMTILTSQMLPTYNTLTMHLQ